MGQAQRIVQEQPQERYENNIQGGDETGLAGGRINDAYLLKGSTGE